MVLYCIIQKLDYWPGLRSSAPPNWDFTIQYSLENWKVVKTMGDGRTSYTDEVSQRFLNLAMKKMTPNSGQTNGVKNMHLWHFWGFFGFRFFFSRWKKPLSFRISIRQKEARVEFCIFILSGCWKKQTKICKEYIWFFS